MGTGGDTAKRSEVERVGSEAKHKHSSGKESVAIRVALIGLAGTLGAALIAFIATLIPFLFHGTDNGANSGSRQATPGVSWHPPTPAPSTPVATSMSVTPTAHPSSEGTPIYQNKEVIIGANFINVDTDKFLPSDKAHGVRVSAGATGLSIDKAGYALGMRLASYSLPSQPDEKHCIAQFKLVAGMDTRDAKAGQYICLRTAGKNIAVIRFKSIKNYLNSALCGPITADITLYRD